LQKSEFAFLLIFNFYIDFQVSDIAMIWTPITIEEILEMIFSTEKRVFLFRKQIFASGHLGYFIYSRFSLSFMLNNS